MNRGFDEAYGYVIQRDLLRFSNVVFTFASAFVSDIGDPLSCWTIRYYLGGEDYWDHTRNGGLDWHRNDTLETAENGTYSGTTLI